MNEIIEVIRKALGSSTKGDAEQVLQAISDAGFACVPQKPTTEMIEAAWADALTEDAEGVWSSMIEAYETSIGNSDKGNA